MKRQEMVFDPFQLLGKKDRKQLTRRNDWIGLSYLGTHLGAIGVSGTGIYLTAGTLFMIPMMFVHGILLACLFRAHARVQPWDGVSHAPAERSRLLVRELDLHHPAHVVPLPSRRASHLHSDPGHGPRDGVAEPDDMAALLRAAPRMALVDDLSRRHHQACLGANASPGFLVRTEAGLPRIYGEARVMLVVYGTVAGLAVFFGSFAPLIYWIIPRILGEPLQRAWRIAEHKGCDEGPDVRTNTRSTRTGAIMRRLCWNMPYHSEHHVCPQVPFFALPELNCLVGNELKPMGDSLWTVDKEVRRTCIVSETQAASSLRSAREKRRASDESWLCGSISNRRRNERMGRREGFGTRGHRCRF